MGFIEAAIFILLFAIISVPIANRARLPLEVFLVIGSGIISIIPGLPNVELNPKIVFNVFLPLILFHAAYFTSWRDFKLNLRPISFLAIGLVIFTMIIVAVLAKWIFPSFSWAESFLLGAIISPTDAASATTIIKKLGAPYRLVAILEGESLVNDATALILFRFSLAAVIAGSFSLPEATLQFFAISIGGIAIGLFIGLTVSLILRRIPSVTAVTTLTFITALISYLFAERLNVSSVIATVVCGIYFSLRFPELSNSHTRIYAKASWVTLIFIINGFVFTLIGLELPQITKNLTSTSLTTLILCGIVISIAVILARLIWVFVISYLSRAINPSFARREPMPPFSVLFILGWCGMRGIVSLAAALSLPFIFLANTIFSNRDAILFVTYCVIVVTILLPAFTLPLLLKLFNLVKSDNKLKQESIARLRSLEGVIEALEKIIKKKQISEDLFNEFRKQLDRRIRIIKTQINDMPFSTLDTEYQAIKILARTAIRTERNTLLQLRREGEINDEVFHMLLEELDLEEMRSKTLRV